jgi:hypothetical protein
MPPADSSIAIPSIVEWARRDLGFEPDPRQEALLASTAHRGIVACTRQWGKSTLAAILAVHRATFFPNKLILVAAPTEKQSAELVRKARAFSLTPNVRLRGDGTHRVSLSFPNGSRIVGIPGREATLRGFSAVSLLIVDEAARVPDETYKALRPMLAVGAGDLWLLSTPFSKSGFFYENWSMGGGEEWTRFSVKATDCPRIPDSFLEEERRQLGEEWFRMEYLCEFIEDSGQMFDDGLIQAAFVDDDVIDFFEFGSRGRLPPARQQLLL